MTTLAKHEGSGLAIEPGQARFTETQIAALTQIGVEKASPGDLEVFFHVCQRSGLDPFARQIYLIGRQVSELGEDGNWRKVTKQTIQTGIDGFRLIGRRAADKHGHAVSVAAPEWAHPDGSWRPVWMGEWGNPVAARVTIKRGGEPFTAVALFDEYKQTKRSGDLTAMWSQRPAGQIAKCAEGLAWRMAFPQDLAGIYTDDEMGQADNPEPEPAKTGLASVLGDRPITDKTRGALFKLMGEIGIKEAEDQREFLTDTLGREVASRSTLTEAEGVKAGKRARAIQQGDPSAEWIPSFGAATGEIVEAELVDEDALIEQAVALNDPSLDPPAGAPS
ncbi:MAG: phage recombination protein Bet [Nocardioidaceae bacterium]|nr:MAG: phage recombination protein Bet [Nocardioidaceae bacterium]